MERDTEAQSGDSRQITGESIAGALSRADEHSLKRGAQLPKDHPDWVELIEYLSADSAPVTYLPVLTSLALARSMRDASELDVLAIKMGDSPRGYAAPSIGSALIRFTEHAGIDLRTTSSSVFNNQPFTYKARILPDLRVAARFQAAYDRFYAGAQMINELNQDDAHEFVALVFLLRRGKKAESMSFHFDGGLPQLIEMQGFVAEYVSTHSNEGKVGQAFAAALYDCVYPNSSVRMGNNNDPSFSVPGDVQVGDDNKNWLWCEVRQRSVVTSEVTTFVDKVQSVGGSRVAYFALANEAYPDNIRERALDPIRRKNSVDLHIYQSPSAALGELLLFAPGSPSDILSRFVNAMTERLIEARVPEASLNAWYELTTSLQSGRRPPLDSQTLR